MNNAEKYKVTEKDIKETSYRFMMTNIATFNYQTQMAPSVAYALAPVLRKLYPDDKEYIAAMDNEYKYFNTQPYMASLITGGVLSMEEQLGNAGISTIQDFKVGLMGPLAGIGDSIFWIIMPAIFTPIAAAMAYQGSYIGWIIECTYWVILHLFRVRFVGYGYHIGSSLVSKMKDSLGIITDSASILGLTVLGALIPSTITVTCPLQWTLSTGNSIVIQDLLNTLLPNFLAVLTAYICATLLRGKKLTMTKLVGWVLVVSIVGAALGILA